MSIEASEEQATPETPAAPQESQPAPASDTPAPEQTETPAPSGEAKQPIPETVPRTRLNEVIAERNRERAEKAQLLAALQQANGNRPQQQAPQAQIESIPKQEDYPSFEAWQVALGRFGAQQEFKTLQQQQQQGEMQRRFQDRIGKAQTNFNTKITAAMATDPSVMDVLGQAPVPLRNDIQVPFMELDHPVEVGKHLAMHPEIVTQLNQMYPDQAARELSKLEYKLAGSTGQPKVSQMPKPMTPVGTAKAGSGDTYTQDKVTAILYPR